MSLQQLRQIGNAVPVLLALALGKAVGSSVASTWAQEDAVAETDREESPEVPMIID
jgi:hypothetical protein